MLNARDHDLLEGLNPEQAAAVSAGPGPLLVLAGAGSGKTRVLTRRMAWLMAHGTAEEALVALTFTNKAAGEMKERVALLLGSRRPRSFVGTFHSFGVRLLRRFAPEAGLANGFVVFDADDQLAVFRHALKAAGITDKTLTPKAVASKISRARNAGWSREEYPRRFGDFVGTRLAELHTAYEKELKKANAVDFDDLLAKTAKLLSGNADVLGLLRRSVTQLLVDEYQDTNGAQAQIVSLLAGQTRNVFAVGDEDQSIYRWRGADVSNILEFERDFPGAKTIRLERNYRSTAPILEAAGAVVAENRRRLGKTLKATKAGGEPVTLLILPEERDEAREVVERISRLRSIKPGAEVAVLFRTNAQSRPFEDELVRARLPYLLVGGTRFYERQEVKDALAYLRLLSNPDDDVSFRRVVNVPARGVGTTTLEGLAVAAATRESSLFAVLSSLPDSLTERAKKALVEFRDLVASLRETFVQEETGAGAAVAAVLTGTGLLALYEDSDDPQDQARRENLDQLLAAARDHERTGSEDEGDTSLAGFLDAVTLRSDADDVDARKGIVLMTLHAAKGLEFDEVFLAGMENGSLPHASSRDDDEELEEERRLAYVGMTRAREKLTLSRVLRRMVHGEWMNREPSPFLDAIPSRALAVVDRTFGGGGREIRFGAPEAGGGLFPDYEGESQETFAGPRPVARPATRPHRPAVPPMRRTPPPPTASGFRRGARVRHPEYGIGVILLVEGSGDQEKLTVYFDRAGRKKFVARFSQLAPV
ncbi:MAG TPA: UvrD-helicase domain-containing protein [Thermoanaerobaculia bacterium]|nr:UvrD-helicase domain-containing protein [Thermoanaerobaculia bacterium]